MKATPKFRVAIVYQYVALYREPIFKRLSADKDVEYTIFSDSRSNVSSLEVVKFEKNFRADGGMIRWKRVNNYWFSDSLLWQSGVLNISYKKYYDVIIFLGDIHYLSTWISAVVARITGKRVLYWGHGFRSFDGGLRSLLKRLYFKIPHGHLLYGNVARDYLKYCGFDDNKLYVVYNALDFGAQTSIHSELSDEKIHAARSKLFENPDYPLLVSMGRIDRDKRLDIVVDAVNVLRQQGFSTNLLVIGDGPDRQNVERIAAGSGSAKSIKFVGAIYGERNLGDLIGSADLCVISGPVGLVIVHAFGYGVPVIAHDELRAHKPEFELMAPGVTGDLYEQGNAQSLAHVVRRWLECNTDRATVTRRCRQAVERFYNPAYQHKVIDHAIRGLPASDLPSPNGAYQWIMRKTWPSYALDDPKINTDREAR